MQAQQQAVSNLPDARGRLRLEIQGIVQGVGFRPFVYTLASRRGLGGFVRNDAQGVQVELEGSPAALELFLKDFRRELPPLAMVDSLDTKAIPLVGESDFRIAPSLASAHRFTMISPDIATCHECAREIAKLNDRRFSYPFTNCTNCGPRFTLIEDIPYDRSNTTMREFALCPSCSEEYGNPADRRFHAEPIACPECGPSLRLLDASAGELARPALPRAAARLLAGEVLAVKGLGGYHLACDATNPSAVNTLRARKQRDDKPFALMVAGLTEARFLCRVSMAEAALLESPARPIVLLERRGSNLIAPLVAPGCRELGVMLPYTPLHHLLLAEVGRPLVMTSGNLTDEPIIHEDEDALRWLAPIADAFLTHNRRIHMRCDDSVARVWAGVPSILRRARGYAPAPLRLPWAFPLPLLACGAELKNTFCLGRDNFAFVSHHVGDLDNEKTLSSYEQAIDHFQRLFQVNPEVIVHDLHPDYLSTRYALEADSGARRVGVQHHHAHIASAMAENGTEGPVIGVAFDGTGYGTDGHLWGGEFLVADFSDFRRLGHFSYFPLPGGSRAIREPWRVALALLLRRYGSEAYSLPLPLLERFGDVEGPLLERMVERGINSPFSCGVGRLFDAASALLTGRYEVTYEGQAAIELEQAADPAVEETFPIGIESEGDLLRVHSEDLLDGVVQGLRRNRSTALLAAAFHNSLAAATVEVCGRISRQTGLRKVVLSGGVFQNRLLLDRTQSGLERRGLKCIVHRQVPANDGGLSLGQAVIGARRTCV